MRQKHLIVLPATEDRRTRILMSGELDVATVGALRATLDALLTRHLTPIEVDLSAVTFFSCAAGQTLRNAYLRAPGSLAVTGASQPARRLLAIMQLQPLLAVPGRIRSGGATAVGS